MISPPTQRSRTAQLCLSSGRRGFTLVEVLIVVVIIGILASILVPRYTDSREEAAKSSLTMSVAVIKSQVDLRFHTTGSWPATIEADWFAGNHLPKNIEDDFDLPEIEVVSVAGKIDPDEKVIDGDAAGAFWYNAANGIVRARVQSRASEGETLVYYNDVNKASATDLGNYELPDAS